MIDRPSGTAAGETACNGAGPACVVGEPYLLALNITLRRHDDGLWADPSWAKDLRKHLAYIPRLTLFCPVEPRRPDTGWARLDPAEIRIVGYPAPRTTPGFLLASPVMLARLWREVRRATVVHSGVAGWPLPLGWAAAPMARAMDKTVVLIVESTFWRLVPGMPAGAVRRWRARWWEWAARRCMRLADYAAYTQPDYQRSLPAPRAGGGRLVQASWVDAADCLSDEAATESWRRKADASPRFLFAARLVPEKGTRVLAQALAMLAAVDAAVAIDIIGDGPERAALAHAADTDWGRAHVRLLDPVPYDAAFLRLLGTYHALLVPGLSDEQPRIVYDGYSQAVPSLASDAAGLRACIADGATGLLVPPGDARGLADAVAGVTMDRLAAWGMAGLARVRGRTHDGLHAARCRDLRDLLDRRAADGQGRDTPRG